STDRQRRIPLLRTKRPLTDIAPTVSPDQRAPTRQRATADEPPFSAIYQRSHRINYYCERLTSSWRTGRTPARQAPPPCRSPPAVSLIVAAPHMSSCNAGPQSCDLTAQPISLPRDPEHRAQHRSQCLVGAPHDPRSRAAPHGVSSATSPTQSPAAQATNTTVLSGRPNGVLAARPTGGMSSGAPE
ncbi:MAG: hypothetical protein QOD83_987, partial [Solirubrobacteraceae bacterium]|nr:hypothetical protein [Solirubrobacteraceae bacterium]